MSTALADISNFCGSPAQIHLYDPDVIVGHEFNGVTLDVLLHRMRDLKAEHWSRIGRFRRAKWPKMKQGTNLKLTAGRLVCDLASDNGKVNAWLHFGQYHDGC